MQYLTAYGALVHIGQVQPRDFVSIPAASSSVGLAAIQIVRDAGATAIGHPHLAQGRRTVLLRRPSRDCQPGRGLCGTHPQHYRRQRRPPNFRSRCRIFLRKPSQGFFTWGHRIRVRAAFRGTHPVPARRRAPRRWPTADSSPKSPVRFHSARRSKRTTTWNRTSKSARLSSPCPDSALFPLIAPKTGA